MRRIITIAVFFVLFSQVCVAQWRKIFDFGKGVQAMYFFEDTPIPTDGFFSTNGLNPQVQSLWKTSDGGFTWINIILPLDTLNAFPVPTSITFKNRSEGWFTQEGSRLGKVYRTTDAGTTWIPDIPIQGAAKVYYHKSIDRVFLTGDFDDITSFFYSNDGLNFFPEVINGTTYTIGVAYSNDMHGIMTTGVIDPQTSQHLYTTDGGITWGQSSQRGRQDIPIGLPGTTIFYAISNADAYHRTVVGEVIRSDDGGKNWSEVYEYHTPTSLCVTGAMQYNNYGIYFQTSIDGSEGIMMSEDSGKSFFSICGPVNYAVDFYVRDTFMYAGDKKGGLWLNTTGIGSNSTPQLSTNNISFISEFCDVKEDTLVFTLLDSCNGRQATLLEASVSGSNRFSVAGGVVPRTIVANDTVRIIYTPDPNSSATENATLNLKLKLGWKVFDTVITLTGRNITPHLDITLTPVLTANNLIAGKEAECKIYSSNRIQDRGLDKVTFDLTYDNDLLEVAEITAQAGMSATYTAPIVTNGIAKLPVTITGNNMTIDSLIPMVSVKFRTFLTDTTLSTIELSTIQLNNDDPDYKNCTLSATGNSTTFTQASICGDSTIRSFMQTGKLIDILSIRPNPAKDEVFIEVSSVNEAAATIRIIDIEGKTHYQIPYTLQQGIQQLHIKTPNIPEGSYFIELSANGNSANKRLQVVR